MTIRLAFNTISLGRGKTVARSLAPGARIRVVDGAVWATTDGSLDDVWLKSGDEHRVPTRGLTVLEAAVSSVVELIPPPKAIAWKWNASIARLVSGLAMGPGVAMHEFEAGGRS
jgi:Protein of unknown function (DUF2917)